jgi:hypothetical protein
VGTPRRDSNTRLYLNDQVRSVFLPDHQSSTAVSVDKGFIKDDLRLGGLKFKTEFKPDVNDMKGQVDSEGRLALSPMSQIGKLRTIHSCLDTLVESDGIEKKGLALDLIPNVPTWPVGMVDIVLPTSTNGLHGWFVRSKVSKQRPRRFGWIQIH